MKRDSLMVDVCVVGFLLLLVAVHLASCGSVDAVRLDGGASGHGGAIGGAGGRGGATDDGGRGGGDSGGATGGAIVGVDGGGQGGGGTTGAVGGGGGGAGADAGPADAGCEAGGTVGCVDGQACNMTLGDAWIKCAACPGGGAHQQCGGTRWCCVTAPPSPSGLPWCTAPIGCAVN